MNLQLGKSRFLTSCLILFALFRYALFEIAPRCIPAGILLISSCADERPPSGGRKDSIAPRLKYADPYNKSLNFKSDKIKLHFSEFIQQTLDPKEIVISPPMDKKPKMTVDGKIITIFLKSKLKDSTTYTINFGDAIKDINEGNTLKNFTYVFATGPILDTAALSGSVSNIANPNELDNIIVALYPADSTDAIVRSKPFYFSKTDRSGAYNINNIHSGRYNVYALKDQNLNYIYDQSDELIGFTDTILDLKDSSKSKVNLTAFLSENSKPKFIDAVSVSPGRILISYNSPVKTLKLHSDIYPKTNIIEMGTKKDSITYWFSNFYNKKMFLNLTTNDTIKDSATIDLKTYNRDSTNNDKKYSIGIDLQSFRTDTSGKKTYIKPILSPFKPLILTLSRPVDSIDENKRLEIVNDSTGKKDSVAFSLDNKNNRVVTVEYHQKEKRPYTLVIPDSTFRDIFGWWNKKMTYSWTSDAKDNYGTIILNMKFEHPDKNYVFKILDADNKAVETYLFTGNESKTITIKNVKAGLYHIQAVEDANNNGQWDSGDFSKKLQPEKIINFRETYEVKGNWDMEIEVKL